MASKQSMPMPMILVWSLPLLVVIIMMLSATPTVNSFQIQRNNHNFRSSPLTSSDYNHMHYISRTKSRLYSEKRGNNGKTKFGQKTDEDVSRFLTDFRTADGTVVDPYKILQVSRSATVIEIKQSYRRLSRKLHPDMVAQMEILPGRCTNLDDVRNEWEKVKFSYEILSDTQMRKSYDRNSSVAEVLNDPGAAVGRAVVGGAMSGLGLVLGGAWKLGEMAAKTIYESTAVADEGKGGGVSMKSMKSSSIKGSNNLPGGNGESIDRNINPGEAQSSTILNGIVGSEQERSADASMISKPRRISNNISETGSYLSQINSPKSSAIETTTDSNNRNNEVEDGRTAMNILTAKSENATAVSGTTSKKRISRKRAKGFGK
ncbi:hypothetical protein ACHAWU_009983 [Discostella pseudostelligera]|uniref:J domain-containing protein n=1 Tax=Discostella pseudostelligera TaxID=259834 RepID=A0ABD3MGH9_9STRA